jgi:Zn-dependent protease
MFLFEPNRTEFDLNFRLFGISVRVHPLFWIISAALGWFWATEFAFQYLVLWIGCVFVSILVHELGHVLVGKFFGSHGYIVLYSLGGLAIGSSDLGNRWQRIGVYFAGPVAQFLILLMTLALAISTGLGLHLPDIDEPNAIAKILLFQLYLINLYWPLFNLLPVWPLDGGRISRDFLDWLIPERGVAASLVVSIVIAGFLAIHTLAASQGIFRIPYLPRGIFTGLFFAMFAVNNFFELQDLRINRRGPWDRSGQSW